MRALTTATLLVLFLIVGSIIGGIIWLGYQLSVRILDAVDRINPVLWEILIITVISASVALFVAGVLALARWLNWRARRLHAHSETGLFPILHQGRGVFHNPNDPKAQYLAVMHLTQRATSASVGRVLDWIPSEESPPAVPQLAPPAELPTYAEVYSSPLPRELALPVGLAADGRQVLLPLRNLGNVLIGGLPGSGKSELLAAMIAGLLRQSNNGQTCQIAVVDTKLVSFGNMPLLRSLWAAPALSLEDGQELVWSVLLHVRDRYEKLRESHARSLEEYRQNTGEAMPYLVVFIDELADLTLDANRQRQTDFLNATLEINRKGRAAGVSMVYATQRPSVDVVPSSLRNLAGAMIAFGVTRIEDSRTILGESGAELLPPIPGRCLVKHKVIVPTQAYLGGLEGGRFDAFCKSLPLRDAPFQTFSGNGTNGASAPAEQSQSSSLGGVPIFSSTDTSVYTAQQAEYIRERFAVLGSLKAVQKEIYAQNGGYWFYRIREILPEQKSQQVEI